MRLVITNPAVLNPDHDGRIQRYIDAQVIKECDPFTPKDTGNLAGDISVKSGGGVLEYNAPYARRHYYNTGGVDRLGRRYGPSRFSGAPQRGAYWFERMKAQGGAQRILRGAAALAGARV